jgi:hypothetical protein
VQDVIIIFSCKKGDKKNCYTIASNKLYLPSGDRFMGFRYEAKIVNTSLRIDGDPDGSLREIEDWTEEVAAYLVPHS